MPRVLGVGANGAVDRSTSKGFLDLISKRYDTRDPVLALQRMATTGDAVFRGNAPLPPEAGEEMDELITELAGDRLAIAAALIEFCERPLPNWWEVTSKQYEKISKQGRARRTMQPGGRGERSQRDRTPASVAIYATEEDFDYHERFISVANASGVSLENDSLAASIENIDESVEDAAINNPGVNFGNITPYGIEDAPNRNSITYIDNEAWDAAGHSGDDIRIDYEAHRDAAFADNHYGPFILFHEKNYVGALNKPYSDGVSTNYAKSVREMLIANNSELIDIRMSDQIADDVTYLIEMKRSSCGMYVGQDHTWIPFPMERFVHPFLALSCMVPYFRDDYGGGSGHVKGTPS